MGTQQLPQKGTAPNFWPMFVVAKSGWIKMPHGMEVGLGPGDFMSHGDPAPPKKGTVPLFSAHVYCGQTAAWIKMPLGTEAGLGPGDIVLNGDPAPSQKRGTAPNVRPMSIVAKWLDASGYHLTRRQASA